MPIASSDIQHLQSASAGSSGGAITGSGITSGVKNNIWTDVTDPERIAGGTEYRKTFFKNNHGTDAASKPVVYYPVAPVNATLNLGLGVDASTDDDPLQGNMTAWSANAVCSVQSDGADTRQVVITGMDNAGTPVPVSETVTLNGTTPVLSATTFSKVFRVTPASTSASRIITVKQGSGGTTRGTIGLNKRVCWLWVAAGTTKANGIQSPDVPAGQSIPVWRRLVWSAGTGSVKPDSLSVKCEEG